MEQTSAQIPTINEKSIEEKKADLQKRKRSFDRKFIFVKIALFFLIAYPIGKAVYFRYFFTPPPDIPKPHVIDSGGKITPTVTQKSFTNKDLMLALSYPSNAEVSEITKTANNSIIKTAILYSADKKAGDAPLKEEDIKNGYYIRITRFISQRQNMNEIIKSKISGMQKRCNESSEFSTPTEAIVDTVKGRTFSITKCEGNWRISYIPRFYSYYEIQQYTVGDFGYIEKYTNEADDIVKTIKFYADEPPLFEEFETFLDKDYRYSIDHRHYNSVCCDVPEPPLGATKRIVLAEPSSIVDGENFDGFGVFRVSSGGKDFDVLLDEVKKTLRDEYVVIQGTEPVTKEEVIDIGGRKAVWLRGYSWRNNDLLYIDTTGDMYNVLILSVVNKSGAAFDEKLNEIFSRMKFNLEIED
jgi:hypothetical protein